MNDHPLWIWSAFGVTLAALLAIDLLLHRHGQETSRRASVVWSVIWIGAGLAFGGFVWVALGKEAGTQYLGAWLIEKSLSVDNLFVWMVIFQTLGVREERQRRVLTWGILGALFFRAAFVVLGAGALQAFRWVNWIFGAILLWAAWRVLREDPAKQEESRSAVWLSRHLPVAQGDHGERFFVRLRGRRLATQLFVALVAVETTDIVFAIDSVPAALSLTQDVFLVYSSNAFAILGLRSLYAVVAHGMAQLRYLHYGLAGVLAFAGLKIVLHDRVHVPSWLSVLVIVAIVGIAIGASLAGRGAKARAPEHVPGPGDRPPRRPVEA